MANKELFNQNLVTTPTSTSTKRIAFGNSGSTAQNITLDDFRKWVTGTTAPVVTTLLQKSFNIGNWSMTTVPGVDVILTGVDRDKIRSIEIIIRSNGNELFPIWNPHSNQEISATWRLNASPLTNAKLSLGRKYGYWFDQSGFSGSGNRGYVLVTYVP